MFSKYTNIMCHLRIYLCITLLRISFFTIIVFISLLNSLSFELLHIAILHLNTSNLFTRSSDEVMRCRYVTTLIVKLINILLG